MRELLFIFIGGGTGAVMRFMASMLWQHMSLRPQFADTVMPWPTLCVNVIGSLLISIFYKYSETWGLAMETRLLLTTGLCGGFTTFSTFSYEGLMLLREGYFATYILYIALSIVLGLVAAALPFVLK